MDSCKANLVHQKTKVGKSKAITLHLCCSTLVVWHRSTDDVKRMLSQAFGPFSSKESMYHAYYSYTFRRTSSRNEIYRITHNSSNNSNSLCTTDRKPFLPIWKIDASGYQSLLLCIGHYLPVETFTQRHPLFRGSFLLHTIYTTFTSKNRKTTSGIFATSSTIPFPMPYSSTYKNNLATLSLAYIESVYTFLALNCQPDALAERNESDAPGFFDP